MADTKVMTVMRSYARCAEKLDIKCAENYITHHYAEVLNNVFNFIGVHHLIVGAIGETHVNTLRMIKKCGEFKPGVVAHQIF